MLVGGTQYVCGQSTLTQTSKRFNLQHHVVIMDLIQSHKRKSNDSITNSVYLGIGLPTKVVWSMDNEFKLVKLISSDIDSNWKLTCLFANEEDKKQSQK